MTNRRFPLLLTMSVLAAACVLCTQSARAQDNSNFHLELNASGDATAQDVGLPAYPGAQLYKKPHDDGSVAFGFSFGDTKFEVKVASYETAANRDEVLAFYRKALHRYGQVLECRNDKPVGKLAVTSTGLTCDDNDSDAKGKVNLNAKGDSDSDLELRAGRPHRYRIAALDDDSDPGMTKFSLVYLETPKDDGNQPD